MSKPLPTQRKVTSVPGKTKSKYHVSTRLTPRPDESIQDTTISSGNGEQSSDPSSIEVKVGPALKAWYKTRFAQSSGSYSAEGSNFCITNFRQRFNECYNPLVWIGCFPCMLLCGPPYCIYRAMNSNDFDCPIRAMVTYIEGVNQAERQQLAQMLVRAYVDGMNAVSNVQPPVPPPYTEQPAPPPYSPSV
ncbi:uncharacterized protein LOC143451752 [Clavelina lepadiformis]|uniref:uncharacterized protein LOC143451752 n=1 Tax=Clavelina lepadiformis TaxID=159417 RepID=UPI0040426197